MVVDRRALTFGIAPRHAASVGTERLSLYVYSATFEVSSSSRWHGVKRPYCESFASKKFL